MKNIYYLIILLGLGLGSCSVEKRLHRSGYHWDWHHAASQVSPSKSLALAPLARPSSAQAWQALAWEEPSVVLKANFEAMYPAQPLAPAPTARGQDLNAAKSAPSAAAGDKLGQALEFLNPIARVRSGLNRVSEAVKSEPKAHGLSIAGFVVSLVGLFIFSLLFGAVAVVFSAIGLSKANRYPEQWKGKGLAITGLVLGILEILFGLILLGAAV